ncbi:PqqD family protein [Nocardioides iriomotensis]|uniref:PqqD family protein n=1 Tax=Nocardioides iriomotensis TaxID=715784 RepID=UPI0013EB64E1|nr:PqqD family protein [Nocardioides iriomotensis]
MSHWTIGADVAWVGDTSRVALVDLKRPDEPAVLTGSSAAIWHTIGHASWGEDVITSVAELFDVPADTVADDVRSFLEDLEARGLITREDGRHG